MFLWSFLAVASVNYTTAMFQQSIPLPVTCFPQSHPHRSSRFIPTASQSSPPSYMNGFHALISEWMFSWQEQGGEGADALEKRLEERDFSFCSFNSNPAAEPLPQQKRGQHEPKFTELLKVFTHPHAFPPLLLHARTSSFLCGYAGGAACGKFCPVLGKKVLTWKLPPTVLQHKVYGVKMCVETQAVLC